MAAKVAAPLPFRRDLLRRPLGRQPGAAGRSGSALRWSGGGGGGRAAAPAWLARARGRNRSGGGRSATRGEEDLGDEDLAVGEQTDLVIVDAGDELAGFRGLVLDISYRPVNVVCWKRAICLEFMEKVSFSASEHLPFFVSIQAHHIWGLWHFRNITNTEIVLAMQADVLEYYDQTVSSPSGSFNIPAVLRVPQLLHVVKRRRRVKQSLSRKNIIYRDGFTCQYCSSGENLTIDHVIPISRGGKWEWENLVTACSRCNSRKGQTLEQANMKLLKTPKAPKEYDILAVPLTKRAFRTLKRNQGLPEEWLQYLASPSP
ncbi:hypothetical protein PR202_ga28250 [Eleusine coracana subsp. coracana]|uniref:HNH nuclease domain-containing protein n=1 Tax=Eleusine coracana subsp. coracana TaxID=191504 RepID=A0AAV5DIR6_ELECO|nr:hypothetical protein PR202_ga28250 [Eleusine coracana subsp. coracana]